MRTIVFYHANCNDGFTAAWAAHKYLPDEALYVPARYGYPEDVRDVLNENPDAKFVYMLDVSYDLAFMDELAAKYKFWLIDHHTGVPEFIDELKKRSYAYYCADYSAALLSWVFFRHGITCFKDIPKITDIPKLIKYVQDRDLWKWELDYSKEVNKYLFLLNKDFDTWNTVDKDLRIRPSNIVVMGQILLKQQEQDMKWQLQNKHMIDFLGMRILAINTNINISELGPELCEASHKDSRVEPGIGAIYYVQDEHTMKFSLRGDGTTWNCAKLASVFDGGGHKNAAGFFVENFNDIRHKINITDTNRAAFSYSGK